MDIYARRPLDYMEKPYIGKDGRDYPTLEAANRQYMQEMMPYKGPDGKYYGTIEALRAAQKRFAEQDKRPIDLTPVKILDDL